MATSKKSNKQSEVITPGAVLQNEPVVSEKLDLSADSLEAIRQEEAVAGVSPESGEIPFLKKLLYIMDSGGWGKFLHPHIEERIAELEK